MHVIPTLRKKTELDVETLEYSKDVKYLFFDTMSHTIDTFNSEEEAVTHAIALGRPFEVIEDTEMLSDIKKILFIFRDPQIYHFFVDFIVTIYPFMATAQSGIKLIFFPLINRNPGRYPKFLAGLIRLFDVFGANYRQLENTSDSNKVYKARNFYVVKTPRELKQSERYTFKNLTEMLDAVVSKLGSKDVAGRKVYISRASSRQQSTDQYKTSNEYIRISESIEEELESVLKLQGFNIAIPEKDFSSIEDQIRYMSEASVIVATSGSGLTNMLFMENGGLVVELSTEIETHSDREGTYSEYVPFFNSLANAKGHTHLTIPLAAGVSAISETIAKFTRTNDIE